MTKIEREFRLYREKQKAVRRIVACYERATKGERDAGLAWYGNAYAIAYDLMPDAVEVAAGIIAALSPRVSWGENVDGAREMIQAFKWGMSVPPIVAGLNSNREKAWSILHHEYFASPIECLNQSERSYKVNRFFANILGDTHVCTIDSWAAKVAIDNAPLAVQGTRYRAIEAAYQAASLRIGGITPRDLQAVCWIHIRGTSGMAKNDPKMEGETL